METYSLTLQVPKTRSARRTTWANIRSAELARVTARWSVATASALAVLVVAIWAAATPSIAQYLAAALWGTGFIFFALAIEVRIKKVMPYILTGMTLPALAVLGSHVAAEFSMLGGVIVAGWLAFWLGRRR